MSHNIYITLSIILILLVYLATYKRIIQDPGYYVIENLLTTNQVNSILYQWDKRDFSSIKEFFLNNDSITHKIHEILPKDYQLINYTYIIENSAIHTFHRDYTSSKNYNNLTYPSYTMILYLDKSDTGLNIIPGSHIDNTYIYIDNPAQKLQFQPGTAIIFDADILHAGSVIHNDIKRHCIQFKIIHKDDIHKLPELQNYHVLINRPNNKSISLKEFESMLTRHFPIFMDIFQEHIKTSFTEDKSTLQHIVSQLIFSDTDFYKPIRIPDNS